ncbi:UTP--glucose-1-phosphate uridylyltransferase GalU [Macrococcoides canis]|uniref:UTP--glucose-1-phosphate uridylyltransferase GalU n=1 Tax=Macrococcoides canis TaxID=1855823 RepID=UPI001AEBA9FA|nr:UTP--glucose-1-phosphate uridylyltransferase GalU [Macrococcus canis]QTQ08916.1 UTP--glucose-1-phosphate uridylyltransferase GalU [Macrococcus canis]UTH07622.1 UTP--glucose-1-phosphate uridylyltransferase GalU [Macrococcus canis]
MKKVRKAVIPAAGIGSRFLPATKAMPKEMLPILDTPTIQYIVEEAVAAGIEDIIIVTGKHKRAIEDHFDAQMELEHHLASKEKFELLKKVQHSTQLANIFYVRQKSPQGLGHAIWTAKQFIGDEPFAVLLGDDIVESHTPAIKQLMEQYERKGKSVIGAKTVPYEDTQRYGIIESKTQHDRLYEISNLIEKPKLGTTDSRLAIMGRYILTPDIFKYLEEQNIGAGGEIQLTDAIARVNETDEVYAYDFVGNRYDVGDKIGFVKTTMEYAIRSEMKEELIPFLEALLEEHKEN